VIDIYGSRMSERSERMSACEL